MRTGIRVLIAVAALNLGLYAFQVISAQLLGPSLFGELAALMALLNIIGLPLAAVQIAVGRRVAELRAVGRHDEVASYGLAWAVGAGVGAVVLLALYAAMLLPLKNFLGLDDYSGLLLLALAIPPSVLLPVALGLLQGEERFREYNLALAATGVLRPVGLLALYFYGLRLGAAVMGAVLASAVGLALAARGCVQTLRGGRVDLSRLWGPLRTLAPTMIGLLAVTALTNVDLLFAKSALSSDDAGLFSADAFLGRVILYLPVAIFAVMLPRVAARVAAGLDPIDILGRTLVVMVPVSLVGVGVLYLLGEPLLTVAFGAEYAGGADDLWLFGLAATLFALVTMYLNYDLARGSYRLGYELAGLAALQVALLWFINDDIRTIVLVDLALGVLAVVYYELTHRGAIPAVAAALAHWRRPVEAGGELRSLSGNLTAGGRDLGRAGGVRLLHAWRRSRFALALTGVYALGIVLATWPVARNMSNSYFGFGNDNLGGIWNFWWWSYARDNGLDTEFSPRLGFPFGFDLGALPVQPWERWMGEGLTHLFGPVAAYNIIILISFPLAGLTMYLLANYLLRNRWAAALAGLIFAFAPFHFGMAMNYPALGSVQFVPLYFLFVARFVFERRARDAAWSVLMFGVMAMGSYYYAYYALWITLAVALVYGVRQRRALRAALGSMRARLRTTRGALTAAALTLSVAATTALMAWKPLQLYLDNRDTLERPVSEAVRYSARVYLWFVPGLDHPVFGERVRPFYDGNLFEAPFNEQSLYLGYIPLVLALVAVVAAVRARGTVVAAVARMRRATGFALVVGATGALITLGPFVPLGTSYYRDWAQEGGTAQIPLLGRLMFEIMPTFRFFSRAQVFVMLALALLAAAGLMWVWRRLGRRELAAALSVLVVAGVTFEYSNRPPARVVDMGPTPAVYEWLADQGTDTVIAQYPMAGAAQPRSFYYQYWHPAHATTMVNVPGTPEAAAFTEQVRDITDPATAGRLAGAGVDLVIVHTSLPPATYPPYQPVLPDDSLPARLLEGYPQLELVREFPGSEVYRVLDEPRETARVAGAVRTGEGFYPPEPSATGPFQWMGDRALLEARALAPAGTRAELVATVSSFGEARTLTVRVDGSVIGRADITTAGGEVRLPFALPAGPDLAIEFTASPAARSPQEVIGTPDPRPLALSVQSVRIVAAP